MAIVRGTPRSFPRGRRAMFPVERLAVQRSLTKGAFGERGFLPALVDGDDRRTLVEAEGADPSCFFVAKKIWVLDSRAESGSIMRTRATPANFTFLFFLFADGIYKGYTEKKSGN